mgnify:CR=1 FL=1
MKFKEEYTFEQRKLESRRVLDKYPDRIPIICERNKRANIDEIDKKKYLVPNDLTCSQFVYVVRKRLYLPAEKAIFLFVNGTIPSSSQPLKMLYREHKDLDGFLYITYSDENVFG